MPLTAKLKTKNSRVVIFDYEDPKKELSPNDLECPFCAADLFVVGAHVRNDSEVRAHFRHKADKCSTKYGHHPESVEHHLGKGRVFHYLKKQYPDALIELEAILPEAGRIADVLCTYSNGARTAHEIQLSPISVEEINERTESYYSAGIDVIWYLGGKAKESKQLQNYCEETFSEVWLLDESEDQKIEDIAA